MNWEFTDMMTMNLQIWWQWIFRYDDNEFTDMMTMNSQIWWQWIYRYDDNELTFRLDSGLFGLEPYLGAWAHVVIVGEGRIPKSICKNEFSDMMTMNFQIWWQWVYRYDYNEFIDMMTMNLQIWWQWIFRYDDHEFTDMIKMNLQIW